MLFEDRKDAAEQLAKRLEEEEWLKMHVTSSTTRTTKAAEEQKYDNAIILAIPRGGVVIGDILASKLNIKLDIIVSRKIGA
jgi:putative phosphoribosyl transferase